MIWESVFLMTVIDLAIMTLVTLALVMVVRNWASFQRGGIVVGGVLVASGLAIIGTLYVFDFGAMHFLPLLIGGPGAMAVMRDLHLNYSFVITLIGLSAFVAGSTVSVRGLVRVVEALERSQGLLQTELGALQQAEERLSHSERRFRSLVENAPVGIHEIALDGTVTSINRVGLEMLGVTESQIKGVPYLSAVGSQDQDAVAALLEDAIQGRPSHFEFRGTGNPARVYASSFIPIRTADGSVSRLMGVTEDITDRRALEQAVSRFRDLLDITPDFVGIADPDGRAVFVNPAGRRLMGFGPEQDLGDLTIADFHGPATASFLANEALPQAIRDGVWAGETAFRTADGHEIPTLQVLAAHFGPEGEVTYFSTIARDISDRIESERRLQQSEEYFRSLIDNAQDIITVVDHEGAIRYQSPSVKTVLGYRPEEMVDQNVLSFVHPDDQQVLQTALASAFAAPRTRKVMEYGFRHKDGDYRILESVWSVRVREDGRLEGIVNSRDVSDRRTAAEKRVHLEAQLRRSQQLEIIGTLAGGVAHDFNNILTPIFGYVEMAMQGLPSDSLAIEDLEQVLLAARRARDLVNQILTFGRQVEPQQVPVRPDAIVREALKLLRASLPSTIQIQERMETSSMVLGDPTQLHQVVMNLGTNAFHAMRDDGGMLEVVVDATDIGQLDAGRGAGRSLAAGPYVRVQVSDSGHGMDEKVVQRIFDPFFTTKHAQEGSGLGLSVVLGIVEGHGGTITVESAPGRGTTFEVYLPRAEVEAHAGPTPTAGVPGGTEHILFVDDEAAIGTMAKRLLERYGYTVTAMSDSEQALVAFLESPSRFDLVLTDYTMPGMTGAELATAMIAAHPEARIVMMTGYSEAMTPERSRQIGIKRYVMKPVVAQTLGKIIRAVLDETP